MWDYFICLNLACCHFRMYSKNTKPLFQYFFSPSIVNLNLFVHDHFRSRYRSELVCLNTALVFAPTADTELRRAKNEAITNDMAESIFDWCGRW